MVLAWSRQHAPAVRVPHARQQHRPLRAVRTTQAGPTDPKIALNRRIKDASSTLELLQLHSSNRHLLDEIHLSALFGKLATACSADSVPDHIASRRQQQQQQLPAMADSTQQVIPGQYQLQQQLQHPRQHQDMLLSVLLDDLQQQIPAMRPRAVSSILWAIAKVQCGQQQQQQQVLQLLLHRAHQQLGFHTFEPRQLCSVAYALTQLGTRKQHSSSSKLHHQHWDAVLLRDLYMALGQSLQFCSAQDAAQAVYTMAQLQHAPPTGWLDTWLKRAHHLLPNFTAQGLANSAYGLARVLELSGQLPGQHSSSSSKSVTQDHQHGLNTGSVTARAAAQWLLACLRVSVLHLPSMQPGELHGQLLWACGKLHCQPPQPAQHHILARGQALIAHSNNQQLATALYCFALLQQKPPVPWLQHFWERVSCKLNTFQGLDLAKLLWAAAQLQLQPPEQLLPMLLQRVGSCLDREQSTQPGYLVSALHSMVTLGWRLPQRYLVRFQAAVVLQLPRFSSRDYSNMLWAFATARVRVDARWLDRVLMSSCSQLSSFSPTDLSITLWAIAKLQHMPSRQWLMQMLSCSLMQLHLFQPSHFSNILWALSKLGSVPSPLWLNTFWSTSGQTMTRFRPAELTATVSAVVKLELTPPVEWVRQLTKAVDQNLAAFDSKRLLHVLQVVQQLQARHVNLHPKIQPNSSSIGVLQYGNSNGGRGYIYSSSIVPFGRLQLQPDSRAVNGKKRLVYNIAGRSPESQLQSAPVDTAQQASTVDALQQLDLFASEAYSMACLVTLMPDWLQHRVAHWPKQLAAERVVASNCQAKSRHLVAVG